MFDKSTLAELCAPPATANTVALPASALSPYVGVYQLDPELQLFVTMREGSLFVQSTGGAVVPLFPESDRDFFLKAIDAQLTFTRNASGVVTGLIVHQYGRDRPANKVR